MTKVKKRFLKIVSGILGLLFGALSFAACYGMPIPEYGSPSASYELNGTIKSSLSDSGINKLKVSFLDLGETYPITDVSTDENGSYKIFVNSFPRDKFKLSVKDIDGDENGSYAHKDLTVDFSDVSYTDGDGKWYNGKKSKNLDVKLDPK